MAWLDGDLINGEDRKAVYARVHSWLWYNFKKDKVCEHCETKTAKRYDYALKKGCSYEKKRDNFLILCRRCHFIYDGNNIKIYSLLRDADCFKRIHEAKKKSITQLSKTGEKIASYNSIAEACQATGVLPSSISNNLYGRSAAAGGFVWSLNNNKK